MMFSLNDRAAVGVYPDRQAAEAAVQLLAKADVSQRRISVVGDDAQMREALRGRYGLPDYVERGIQYQSEREGIWLGGLFGLMAGFGSLLLLPGMGLLALAGPFAGLVAGMVLGAFAGIVGGQLTVTDFASEYRGRLAAQNFLVLVRCTLAQEPRVFQAFENSEPHTLKSHRLAL